MANKFVTFSVEDYKFFTINYALMLEKTDESIAFHTMHDFLRTSEIGLALQDPNMVSGKSVLQICTIAERGKYLCDIVFI